MGVTRRKRKDMRKNLKEARQKAGMAQGTSYLDRCIAWKGMSRGMDNIKVTIVYRNGEVEVCYVTDYGVKNSCLSLYQRYKETRYIPMDRIKEWKVCD